MAIFELFVQTTLIKLKKQQHFIHSALNVLNFTHMSDSYYLCGSIHSPRDVHTGPLALACVGLTYGLREKCLPQLFNAGQLPNSELLCAIS